MVDAKAVFDEAKSKGVRDGFEKVEERLGLSDKNNQTIRNFLKNLDSLMRLYKQNRLHQVFNEGKNYQKDTKSLVLWNILGASAAQIGQIEQAILAFNKAFLSSLIMPRPIITWAMFSKSKISWKKQ